MTTRLPVALLKRANGAALPLRLGLTGHRALHAVGQNNVSDLHSSHFDSPRIGLVIDDLLQPQIYLVALITLLQQYVAEKDLDAVVAVVKSLAATANLEKMKLTAKGLYHIPGGKIGLQGITIKPSDEILALQTKVIQAMAPFRKSGGDQAAFVPDPTGTPFDPFLFKYVDSFVEKQTGENYNPHVTTGTAPLEWLKAREQDPFQSFEFGVNKLTVYKLGNFGTAAKRLGG